jgi:AcrR family transcriptional regulator
VFYYRTVFGSSTVFDMPDDDPAARAFSAGPVRIRVTTGRGAGGRSAPKERLSADRIVDVALAQMKENGYESVSMRSIARALGTGPASLYAHVANRDELDALVIERVASQIEVPDPDPARWREQLRDLMLHMMAAYQAHPGVARASLGIIPMSPRMLVTTERIAALLRAGGVPDQAAAWFLDQMTLYVSSVAVEQDVWRQRGAWSEEHFESVHQFFHDLPASEFPVLSSLSEAMTTGDHDDRFGFGIDLLITGLAAYAEGTAEIREPGTHSAN